MGRVRFRFQVQEFRDYKDLVSYVTPDWSFSSGVRNLFCLQSITDNAGEALFVEYVIGIRVVSMEVVSPDL